MNLNRFFPNRKKKTCQRRTLMINNALLPSIQIMKCIFVLWDERYLKTSTSSQFVEMTRNLCRSPNVKSRKIGCKTNVFSWNSNKDHIFKIASRCNIKELIYKKMRLIFVLDPFKMLSK